jgi:phytoene/squalene synthetase
VGRLVLALCQCRDPQAERFSDAVCTGLQLANFWQDVAVDRRKGRVYLPQEDLRRFGVQERDLSSERESDAVGRLLLFEVDRAESYLRRGRPVAAYVPFRLGIVVGAFAEGGLAVLRKIRASGGDVLTLRPRLTRGELAGALVRAAVARCRWSIDSSTASPAGAAANGAAR